MFEFLNRFFNQKETTTKRSKRYYNAGKVNRLTASWATTNLSADKILNVQLPTLRARSRDLERNNVYYRRYLNLLVQNVVGHSGVKLQATPEIEEAFKLWAQKGNCTVDGQLSFRDLQRLIIRTVARDGEVLVRKIFKQDGFYLQVLEAEYLDETYTDENKNIFMGIEFDKYGKPIAYHILTKHPDTTTLRQRQRIKAEDIIHLFIKERPSQSRGVPWGITAASRLNMLDGYEEAELVAARLGASKMGFYKQQAGDEFTGEDTTDNDLIFEVEPGVFELLPPGIEVETFDPSHPNSAYAFFVKNALKGIASGLNVSYVSLANDLESVNYSSIRAGVLEEREYYKTLQNWFIENFINPVYEAWLDYLTLTTNIKPAKATWLPKRWDWVDPLKDVQANIKAVEAGFKSRTQIVAEQGNDFVEVVEQLQKEEELLQKLNTQRGDNKNDR